MVVNKLDYYAISTAIRRLETRLWDLHKVKIIGASIRVIREIYEYIKSALEENKWSFLLHPSYCYKETSEFLTDLPFEENLLEDLETPLKPKPDTFLNNYVYSVFPYVPVDDSITRLRKEMYDSQSMLSVLKAINIVKMQIAEELMLIDTSCTLSKLFCQALFDLLVLFLLCMFMILSNSKKKTRMKYRCEKVTLLILWKCGDVEQNPGPPISDIKRDFCKKMISLLLIRYQESQLRRKPIQADYKKKPAGWPDGVQYKDPSKCTNDVRNAMLNTIQQLCIGNGVEIPAEWTNLTEKYLGLQMQTYTKAKQEEIAGHLHSWLSQLRSFEMMDQTFDRLTEIGEQERYEVLAHMYDKMQQYLPDLSSQCLQSRRCAPNTGKTESETNSSISLHVDSDRLQCGIHDVPIDANDPNKENDNDLAHIDRDLDGSGKLNVNKNAYVTLANESQMTSNEGFATETNALDTVQSDNTFTSCVKRPGDDNERIPIKDTSVELAAQLLKESDPTGTPVASVSDVTRETKRQTTANEFLSTDNSAVDSEQSEIITSFLELLGDCNTPFATSTAITSPHVFESSFGRVTEDDIGMKRKLDTSGIGNETEIAAKRYKLSNDESVAFFTHDTGASNLNEIVQNNEESHVSHNASEMTSTLSDLMRIVESESVQEIDSVPGRNVSHKSDDQGDDHNANDSLLDELLNYLSDEFIKEHSLNV